LFCGHVFLWPIVEQWIRKTNSTNLAVQSRMSPKTTPPLVDENGSKFLIFFRRGFPLRQSSYRSSYRRLNTRLRRLRVFGAAATDVLLICPPLGDKATRRPPSRSSVYSHHQPQPRSPDARNLPGGWNPQDSNIRINGNPKASGADEQGAGVRWRGGGGSRLAAV
jgi:hypothetical protein